MTAATLASTDARAALYAAGYTDDTLAADRAAMESHAARTAFDMALQDVVIGDDVICFRTDAMRDALRHVLPDASPLRAIMRCHVCDETADDCDCIVDHDGRLVDAASVRFRDAGYTVERLRVERAELMPRLSLGSRCEWESMLTALASGQPPRFLLDSTRYALRRYGIMRQSPMTRVATCDGCGEGASECRCATGDSGHLYSYTCPECDAPCEDGEPCCSTPDDAEDDEYTPPPAPAPADGYSRGPWERIERRDVEYHGRRYAFAPYYCGIELETDSTPTPDDWRELFGSSLVLGAWHDGTVRGPEIVSQPAKGYALARVVELFSSLNVSLTSNRDPIGQQCGMHIHVDAREARTETRLAFVRLWMTVQDALWARPDMHLRRGGGYCGRLSQAEAQQVERVIKGEDTYGNGYPSRYRDCNFAALAEHRTIEIRLFGWPDKANRWSATERAAFMWRCIRTAQGLRLAARLVGDSGLGLDHPIYQCDSETAIALIEALIPDCPVNEGSK